MVYITTKSNKLEFFTERESFADALTWVVRNLPSRPTTPSLAGIMLTGLEDSLILSSFDYEVSSLVFTNAEIIASGKVLISGRLLSILAKHLPSKNVKVFIKNTVMTLICGSAHFSLPILDIGSYPELLPSMPEETGTLLSNNFSEAISQVSVAACRDDTIPMLTGIRIEFYNEKIILVATDRFRLAIRKLEWITSNVQKETAILVPSKILVSAGKVFSGAKSNCVHLLVGSGLRVGKDGLLGIVSDNKQISTRLLNTEFPEFNKLIPKKYNSIAFIKVKTLTESIKRMSLVSSRVIQVKMKFSINNLLHLSAGSDDIGWAKEEIVVKYIGSPLIIAFNPAYLIEGLASLHSEYAILGFTSSSRPSVLLPAKKTKEIDLNSFIAFINDSSYIYLIMPVKIFK